MRSESHYSITTKIFQYMSEHVQTLLVYLFDIVREGMIKIDKKRDY